MSAFCSSVGGKSVKSQRDGIIEILTVMKQEQVANAIGALPVSVVAPSAPTKGFINAKNTTSGPELTKRMRSLCDVIYNYLGAVMTNLASFITDSLTAENILGMRDVFTEIPLTGVTQAFLSLIITPAVITAFQDEAAIREFVCCFRDGLANTTDATFQSFNHVLSQVVCSYQNPHATEIHNIMYWANRDERNYKIFMAALSDEYSRDIDETVGSTGDCEFCGDPCTQLRVLGNSPFEVRVTYGIWVPGVGFKGEPYTTPQNVPYTRLWIEVLCPSAGSVRTVEIDAAFANNGGGGALYIATMNGTTVTRESGGIPTYNSGNRAIYTWTNPNLQYTADRIRIRQDTPVANGQITLYSVKAGPGNPPLP